MTYAQVGVYGMNDKVGLVSFNQDDQQFNKPYSNETAHLIDTEVRRMVHEAYQRTIGILTEKKDLVTALAERLLDRDVSLLHVHQTYCQMLCHSVKELLISLANSKLCE